MSLCPHCSSKLSFGAFRVQSALVASTNGVNLADTIHAWFCGHCGIRSEEVAVGHCDRCKDRVVLTDGEIPVGYWPADKSASHGCILICTQCAENDPKIKEQKLLDAGLCLQCGENPAVKRVGNQAWCLPCYYKQG